jgi:drug/metabolite transporter (DMT)-like permease
VAAGFDHNYRSGNNIMQDRISEPSTSKRLLGAGGEIAKELSSVTVIALFAFVVCAWGLNWVVMKIAVKEMTPVWAVALRTWIAFGVLLPAVALAGQLILPPRSDLPVVLIISLFHMAAFAVLMTAGLKYVSVGRTVVLGFTTPIWVAPAAWMFLREPMPFRRVCGIGLGLAGILLIFEPHLFDWHDGNALFGNGLVLGAALCWSISIIYTRAHRWTATAFQLVLWETLVAAVVLTGIAAAFEGAPQISLSAAATAALLYNGAIGTALGFWAMTVVNKELPAAVASLGVLATPVIGLGLSALMLHENLDAALVLSSLIILAGIVIGIGSRR